MITTEDVVEETSRASTKVERRHQHIGVEDDAHSACWLAAGAAAARFHRGDDGVFGQAAGSRSFFSIGKELIPSSASLRVLAERFAQKFAARPALLVGQAVDLHRELWWERDGHCPGRAHEQDDNTKSYPTEQQNGLCAPLHKTQDLTTLECRLRHRRLVTTSLPLWSRPAS